MIEQTNHTKHAEHNCGHTYKHSETTEINTQTRQFNKHATPLCKNKLQRQNRKQKHAKHRRKNTDCKQTHATNKRQTNLQKHLQQQLFNKCKTNTHIQPQQKVKRICNNK